MSLRELLHVARRWRRCQLGKESAPGLHYYAVTSQRCSVSVQRYGCAWPSPRLYPALVTPHVRFGRHAPLPTRIMYTQLYRHAIQTWRDSPPTRACCLLNSPHCAVEVKPVTTRVSRAWDTRIPAPPDNKRPRLYIYIYICIYPGRCMR